MTLQSASETEAVAAECETTVFFTVHNTLSVGVFTRLLDIATDYRVNFGSSYVSGFRPPLSG